jgi:hypothetical protein
MIDKKDKLIFVPAILETQTMAVRLDEEGMCGRTVEAIEQPIAAVAC